MTFADSEIVTAYVEKRISIAPFNAEQINPASYDLRLSHHLQVRSTEHDSPWRGRGVDYRPLKLRDVAEEGEYLRAVRLPDGMPYVMAPGEFLLAATEEIVSLDRGTVARVEGKSSLARVGLAVHVTGGFIDPGFHGQITLEMVNLFHRPLVIDPGMRIAQIAFSKVDGIVAASYEETGRYQNQMGATLSRYKQDR